MPRTKKTPEEKAASKAESNRRWRLANPDKVKESRARFYKNHREQELANAKRHRLKKLAEDPDYENRYQRERRAANPELREEYNRYHREYNTKTGASTMNTMITRQRHPEKHAARVALAEAIRKGRLVRPEACSICFAPCKPDAHHEDYSKPLDVIWVCRPCHVTKFPGYGRPSKNAAKAGIL